MSDDTLIRVGDGTTREWTLSPANTGLTAVTVNGVAVGYTRPAWNKVKLNVAPAYGTQVSFKFTGTVAPSGGAGGDGGAVTVDNTPVLTAVGTVGTEVAAVKASVQAVQTAVAGIGAGGSGAVPGEVKLFALTNGQAIPQGWELDKGRAPTISGFITAAYGLEKPLNTYVGVSYVNVGNRTFSYVANSALPRALFVSEPFTGVRTQVATTPVTYTANSAKPVVMAVLNGKLILTGGFASSTVTYQNVYEYNVDTQVFTQLANLPIAISDFSLCALDADRLLLVGGATNTSHTNASAALYLYTRSTNAWQLLAAALVTGVALPRVAKLPSGKVFIASGMNATTIVGNYYVFDPATLSLTLSKTTGALPSNTVNFESLTFRTTNGVAYRTGQGTFTEYNEALDSFAPWVYVLPLEHASASTTNYTFCGTDLVAPSAGHVLMTGVPPVVLMNAQYAPSYNYLRKQ